MPRSRRFGDGLNRDEDGSAALEFITAGVLLLVPLVYLVVALAAIQAGAFAVEGAARQAARVFVQAPDVPSARARADIAVDFAMTDFGLPAESATLSVQCTPVASRCLTRRGFVTVTVVARVPLPLAPAEPGVRAPFAVPLTAVSTEQVSRFWGEAQ